MLVLLTTLSAGVPAYWLTRVQLEEQTWARVASSERSTRSLLAAERERLENLLTLLTERPTLHRLLREESSGYLVDYLREFERQSAVDLLLLCSLSGASAAEGLVLSPCTLPIDPGFTFHNARPAIMAALPLRNEPSDEPVAMAIAGIWLDEVFLRQLASNTGVEQSVLSLDGTRLASSMGSNLDIASGGIVTSRRGAQSIRIGTQRFYIIHLPLTTDNEQPTMLMEIALPVDELFITENQALGILAISTGLVGILGSLLVIWAVRRLTTPLEQLTHAAEAISAGDLAAPIPAPTGPSEVHTLATALHKSQASMLTALEELAQAHDWLDNLIQSIVEGVVTIDNAGHVTFINEKAAELTSLTAEEALGCHIENLFSVFDESENRISLQHLSLGGRHRLALLRDGSGSVQPPRHPGQRTARRLGKVPSLPSEQVTVVEVTATRLSTANSQEMLTAFILRDITQEESLRHLRSYFLANITHEFRTPLSTLSASMELLMDEGKLNAEEMRELLKPLHRSLVSLQTLIDNLLESSSIEAGRFTIRNETIDLGAVIASAIRVVQPLLERREQKLTLREPASLPTLVGDSARLTQVLVNLLSNASKYAPPNSSIALDVAQIKSRLRISIADQGPGIPIVEREHLFRRFVRLEATDGEQYGIGLGLYVVKTTVEAHGGQVGIDERPGGGSIFWFELPLEQHD